jgi:hypothetical protein
MTTHLLRPLAAFACGALLSLSALAQTSSAFALHDMGALRRTDGPRLSVYWQVPFEGPKWRAASYGLRLDSAPIRYSMVDRLPLFDLRAEPHRTSLLFSGVPAFRMTDSSDGGKGKFESLDWSNPWVWVITGAATLGIACATENWPCQKNDSKPATTPTGTPPTTGGTPTTGG